MNANETFKLPKLTDTQLRCLLSAKTCTATTGKLRKTRKLPVGPASAALAKLGLAVKWTPYGEKRHAGYTLTDEGMLVFDTYAANENRKRDELARFLKRLAGRLERTTTPIGMDPDEAFGILSHLGEIEDTADALFEVIESYSSRAYSVFNRHASPVVPPTVD